MTNHYFTIKTIDSSGLGDQLGTQFARLYTFGLALGLEFIYTPIYFKRSVKPDWFNVLQITFLNIRSFLLRVFGQSFFSSIVNVVLFKIEKRVDIYLENYKDNLSDFLGLKLISNAKMPKNIVIKEIDLTAFVLSGKVQSIESLKQYLLSDIETEREIVFNFSWTADMWGIIPKLDEILQAGGFDKLVLQKQLFSSVFHQIHSVGRPEKQLVFHIRCGDSTTVHLIDTDLIVYDKYLYSSEAEMTSIFEIDKDRHSVLPIQFLEVFEKIKENDQVDVGSITVISDGYDLTYSNIMKNLLKRRNKIRLTKSDKKLLLSKVKERNDIFKEFSPANLIVGESQVKLEKSILSIANAELLVWGCGGFAVNTHLLFNNVSGKIINIKNWS